MMRKTRAVGAGGVYAIRRIQTNRRYVGATTTPFQKRWLDQRSALRSRRHENPYLQADWCEFGETSFVFEVLEVVTDVAQLQAREHHWRLMFAEVPGVYNVGGTIVTDDFVRIGALVPSRIVRVIGLLQSDDERHFSDTLRRILATHPDVQAMLARLLSGHPEIHNA